MSKVTDWELTIRLKNDKQYEEIITFLGKSHIFVFEANTMVDDGTGSGLVHLVTIRSSWTKNLDYLAEWIDINISDEGLNGDYCG